MKRKLIERLASAACAFVLLLSSANSVSLPWLTSAEEMPEAATEEMQAPADETLPEIPDEALPETAPDEAEPDAELCHQNFELHPNGEEAGQIIMLDGLMPEGATAEAVDTSDAHEGITAYDITITDGESEFQPGEAHPILVEITDPAIPENGNLVLWHIRDDGERESVPFYTLENGRIRFYATGFSVYEIVEEENIKPSTEGWQKVSSLEELKALGRSGLYIGHTDGYYFMNGTTGDTSRTGITKTKPASDTPPTDKAAIYYFEQVGDSEQFYVYCCSGSEKQYVYNGDNNSLSFTTEENKTAFTATYDAAKYHFRLCNGEWYWNMQSGASGTRFCSYDKTDDSNNALDLWYYEGESQYLIATRTAAATPEGEGHNKEYEYVASYETGATDGTGRTDTVINTRKGGLAIRLFQWDSCRSALMRGA